MWQRLSQLTHNKGQWQWEHRLLLVTEQGLQAAGGLEALFKLPGLEHTPAGRSRAVIAMDALRLLGFGPRMPEAVLALHQALYAV